MSFLVDLRSLAYLKRIAIALEEANRISIQKMEKDTRKRSNPKLAEIFTPSASTMNDLYQQDTNGGKEEI